MRATAVLLTLVSGLHFLPACLPLRYILIEKSETWFDAEKYCKEKYVNLATVRHQEDLAKLNALSEGKEVWIGLRPDSQQWTWSLSDPDYSAEGQSDFEAWSARRNRFGKSFWKLCATIFTDGGWNDVRCEENHPFICYDKNAEPSVIYVAVEKSWAAAQRYCRKHHTDLASVRNQTDNDLLTNKPKEAWIGLQRKKWKWSDGSALSVSNWSPAALADGGELNCGASVSGKWVNEDCDNEKAFVCYTATQQTRVKVVLSRSDSSVDMEALQEEVLEELNRRVAALGLSANVKLRWTKQPDGKIFHQQEEEKKEKKEEGWPTCPAR